MANVYIHIDAPVQSSKALQWVLDSWRHCLLICEEHGFHGDFIDEVHLENSSELIGVVLKVDGENAFEIFRSLIPAPEKYMADQVSILLYPEISTDEEFPIANSDLIVEYYRKKQVLAVIPQADSNVRLAHVPTGIVARCQSDRSRIRNYEKALSMLKSRLSALRNGNCIA